MSFPFSRKSSSSAWLGSGPLLTIPPLLQANHKTHRHTKHQGRLGAASTSNHPEQRYQGSSTCLFALSAPDSLLSTGLTAQACQGFAISSCDCDGCTQRTETCLPAQLGRFISRLRTGYAVHSHGFLFPMFFFGRPSIPYMQLQHVQITGAL
ncbi:hypothetical protein GGI42DRAFT_11270 [Trichoderma sp. SZMC 28013]